MFPFSASIPPHRGINTSEMKRTVTPCIGNSSSGGACIGNSCSSGGARVVSAASLQQTLPMLVADWW